MPDGRRRVKIATTLEDFSERVQYSVLEFKLEQKHLDRLRRRLTRIVEGEHYTGDSTRVREAHPSKCGGVETATAVEIDL